MVSCKLDAEGAINHRPSSSAQGCDSAAEGKVRWHTTEEKAGGDRTRRERTCCNQPPSRVDPYFGVMNHALRVRCTPGSMDPRVCTRAAGGIRDSSTAVCDPTATGERPTGKGSSALSTVAQLVKGGQPRPEGHAKVLRIDIGAYRIGTWT
jgi:hypothetical protein